MPHRNLTMSPMFLAAATLFVLTGCATATQTSEAVETASTAAAAPADILAAGPEQAPQAEQFSTFEQDRAAILSMAGDYKVSFDFTETVPLVEGYELKDPKRSGGHESVRVVEDRGDFISLQHMLVVGPDDGPFVIKHWRQDWQYEPDRVLMFIGGNAWEWRAISAEKRKGAWSQTVYQVDDAPRYAAVATWTYEDGLAEWEPPREWRPLPRRDMTTRDDYHAIDAVNRHVITPWGWVHEQDNTKLILSDTPTPLVREIGVNTYKSFDGYPTGAADEYWNATADFWAGVRTEWSRIGEQHDRFAITIKGETEALYMPLLGLASGIQEGEYTLDEALADARSVIESFVTSDIGQLADRLRPQSMDVASADLE